MRWIVILVLMSCLLAACNRTVTSEPPDPRDAAEMVLRAVADRVCPGSSDPDAPDFYRRFYETDTAYTLNCFPAAGHSTSATIEWFDNQAEAQAAFEARRGADPTEAFKGFPAAVWEEDYPSFPGGRKEYRIWLWPAQHWLIEVRAFDDTDFLIAPDPEQVSEAIYQVGLEHGVFSGSN